MEGTDVLYRAKMTSQAVLSHIAHFCSKLPSLTRNDVQPIYDLDPPDYPIGYHAIVSQTRNAPRPLNPGPFSATLTLPRLLPPELRVFHSMTLHDNKKNARKEAAFVAYKALFEAGLLNENLLCSDDTSRNLNEASKSLRGGTLSLPQSDPWQASPGSAVENPLEWYENTLEVERTGAWRFFTRNNLGRMGSLSIILYGQGRHAKRTAVVTSKSLVCLSPDRFREARLFTRRLFSVFHSRRLEADNLDFSYLLASSDPFLTSPWEERRTWAEAQRSTDEQSELSDVLTVNLAAFGDRFNYPTDLGILMDGWSYFEFDTWRTEPLSEEEKKQVQKHYHYVSSLAIAYPLVVAKPIKHKANFLTPLVDATPIEPESIILLPSHTKLVLESKRDADLALALPSILRATSSSMAAMSLKMDVLDREPSLKAFPIHLLQMALTSPNADAHSNYERLESLGDAILKFVSTIQLLATHPILPAGFIVNRRQKMVSNQTLSEVAMKNYLYRWIIRTPFVAKHWKPNYQSSSSECQHKDDKGALFADSANAGCHVTDKAGGSDLSKKILADVVEALIGAAYLGGDFNTSIDCMNALGIDADGPWKPLSHNISEIFNHCKSASLPKLDYAEKIIGYDFRNRGLLLEALMDTSNSSTIESMSYERLQLIGDAILDMLVIDTLYRTEGRRFSPAEMHSRKIAVVNYHHLAFICLRAHIMVDTSMPVYDHSRRTVAPSTQQRRFDLSRCLIHSSSSLLDEQRRVSQRYEEVEQMIADDLHYSNSYPWAALASICAPKWYSDIVESIIGAVFIDCGGRMDIVKGVVAKLGIMELLDRLKVESIDLLHPVNRVMEWAGKHQVLDSLRIISNTQMAKKVCSLELHGRSIATVLRDCSDEVSEDTLRLLVASEALPTLLKADC